MKRRYGNIISLIYVFIFFITISASSFTSISLAQTTNKYNDYAVKLSKIKVFQGTNNGFELDREPTRLEGLIMLIRLLGAESEAQGMKNEPCEFTDVPNWGKGYVNYAYKNNLTSGIGNGKFGSSDSLNAKVYVTFVLRALGYDDTKGDFTYKEAIDKALEIELLDGKFYLEITKETFTRGHVAKVTYNTLRQKVNNNENILAQKLINDGKLNESMASSIGLLNNLNEDSNDIDDGSKSILSSTEIGELMDAVVYIEVTESNGTMSSGSGFYVSSDGKLVTNYHVIETAKSIKIINNSNESYTGSVTILGYDIDKDIALLKINKTVDTYLTLGDSNNIKVGEKIYAIGSPEGYQNTLSDGIVSAVREKYIQITAPISHGSSGGALLNEYGEVIGITSAGNLLGENLGFAIPINDYIAMSKNLNITLGSHITAPSSQVPATMDDLADLMMEKYGTVSYSGYTYSCYGAITTRTEEGINVLYFLDKANAYDFIEICIKDTDFIDDYYAAITEEVSNLYNDDAYVTIALYDEFSEYPPSGYEENSIFSTIEYNNQTGMWEVFYTYATYYTSPTSTTIDILWYYF